MEGGGVMQVDQLAQVCEPDTFAVTRVLFENGEGAAERLNADPLAIVGVVVDIALRRLHQLGDGGLARAGRLLTGLLLGTRSHRISLHATVPNCAVALSLAAAAVHTTPVQGEPHT